MIVKGTILFHGTASEIEFKRLRGPAFLTPSIFLAWEEGALDHPWQQKGRSRILVYSTKKNIKTESFSGFLTWFEAILSIKQTRKEAYEHILKGEKEFIIRTPLDVLKFLGEIRTDKWAGTRTKKEVQQLLTKQELLKTFRISPKGEYYAELGT